MLSTSIIERKPRIEFLNFLTNESQTARLSAIPKAPNIDEIKKYYSAESARDDSDLAVSVEMFSRT